MPTKAVYDVKTKILTYEEFKYTPEELEAIAKSENMDELNIELQMLEPSVQKFIDGELTEEEFAPIRTRRKELLEELNALQ